MRKARARDSVGVSVRGKEFAGDLSSRDPASSSLLTTARNLRSYLSQIEGAVAELQEVLTGEGQSQAERPDGNGLAAIVEISSNKAIGVLLALKRMRAMVGSDSSKATSDDE